MMKKLTAALLAGLLAILALAAFASCKKKDKEDTDDSDRYAENTVVVNYLRTESKTSAGAVQTDEHGNTIYDYFEFEAIDSNSTRLIEYRAEIKGAGKESMLRTYARHEVVIPETFGERAVTEIAEEAFRSSSSITGVKLPAQLEVIGAYAFARCSELEEISIPATVVTVGEGAFYQCVSLKTISFAEGIDLKEIPAKTFFECKALTSLTIPASVETIGEGAFYGTEAMQTVVLSAGVKKLAKMAFFGTKAPAAVSASEP